MDEDKQDKLWPKVKNSYFDLSGKVAIVTGGASGIGRSLAEGLAEYGASIIICGRRLTMCEVACNEIRKSTGGLTFPLSVMSLKMLMLKGLLRLQ